MNHNEAPIIVGLDIGTTKIAAIAGRKNEYGKLEILGLVAPIAMAFSMGKFLILIKPSKRFNKHLKIVPKAIPI